MCGASCALLATLHGPFWYQSQSDCLDIHSILQVCEIGYITEYIYILGSFKQKGKTPKKKKKNFELKFEKKKL